MLADAEVADEVGLLVHTDQFLRPVRRDDEQVFAVDLEELPVDPGLGGDLGERFPEPHVPAFSGAGGRFEGPLVRSLAVLASGYAEDQNAAFGVGEARELPAEALPLVLVEPLAAFVLVIRTLGRVLAAKASEDIGVRLLSAQHRVEKF